MHSNLKPEEIRLLSKVNNCCVTEKYLSKYCECEIDIEKEINMFIKNGLLRLSDFRYALGKLTVQQLKQIAVDNGLSVKGRKTSIVDDILANVSKEDLEELCLEKYFVLTTDGERVVEENSALLLWYDGLKHNVIKPENIIAAQCKYENRDKYELLLTVYNEHLQKSETNFERFDLLLDIKRIYQWQHNEEMEEKISAELSKINDSLNKEWEAKYENAERQKILGLSEEERQRLRDEAIAELDEEWEKEVDAKYRAMVGL